MPCLIIKTNQNLTEKEKHDCGLSASAKTAEILGKPESYVMTVVEDNISMTMAGSIDPAVYMELKSINLPEEETSNLSDSLCKHIGEALSVPPNRIYIEFSNAQRHLWGWDGRTF